MLCMTLAVVLLLSSLAFASAEEEKVFNLVTSSNSIATKLDAVWVNRGDLFKTLVFRSLFLPDTTLTNLSPDLAASYHLLKPHADVPERREGAQVPVPSGHQRRGHDGIGDLHAEILVF